MSDYDLIIVGGGPAGCNAAERAATVRTLRSGVDAKLRPVGNHSRNSLGNLEEEELQDA